MGVLSLDHFQVSVPWGRLPEALAFYVDVLGFTRVPKPAELSQTGAWLVAGTVNLHIGEETEFEASPRAHPAFCVDNIDELLARATQAGRTYRMDDGPKGYKRGSVFDPFGNRIELMQKLQGEN
jgi:catechol 2,3-dioxygenase-like lactoylglutathione lyase family enzyme